MKIFLLAISITICFIFSFIEKSEAQYVTIPDTAFVNWLNANGYASCMTGNQLDTNCSNLSTSDTLIISGINIHDVNGIQYFHNLYTLSITNTLVDSIFDFPSGVFPGYFILLNNNSQLSYIHIANGIYVDSLDITYCAFTDFPLLPDTIGSVNCSFNSISTVSSFPAYMDILNISNNQLTQLPHFNDWLWALIMNNNPNLTCLTNINYDIQYLEFNNTSIACVPNHPWSVTSSIPDVNSYPLCSQFNPDGCVISAGVSGTVYSDNNSNCVHDGGEAGLSGIAVRLLLNNNMIAFSITDNFGGYSFDVSAYDTYTVKIDTGIIPFQIICPSDGIDTSIISATDSVDINRDYSLQCDAFQDGEITAVVTDSGMFRPAGKALVKIFAGDIFSFYNASCFGNLSGTVTATFSGSVSYDGVKAGSPVPTVTGNTLIWTIADFDTVDPYHDFHVRFITDTSAALGSAVCINATISINQTDANAANNSASNCFMVQTSFDPNYKEVNQSSLTYQPIPLTYTIHFQNTGTASANNIYILDTLDSELDLSSFRFLGASHYCIPQILQGGILRFNFPNINLPDSNSNEPASHGWAQYSIEQRSDIDPTTVIIENTANIYFDFNSAVVTNTTVTPFAEGIEEQKTTNDFILYPNPASSELTVMLRQAQRDNYTIEIKDALGRKVFSKIAEQKKQTINISSLPSGIYFVELFSTDGKFSAKKLIVVK